MNFHVFVMVKIHDVRHVIPESGQFWEMGSKCTVCRQKLEFLYNKDVFFDFFERSLWDFLRLLDRSLSSMTVQFCLRPYILTKFTFTQTVHYKDHPFLSLRTVHFAQLSKTNRRYLAARFQRPKYRKFQLIKSESRFQISPHCPRNPDKTI